MIAASFGEDVAALVQEVTDDKSLDKAVRKRKQVESASKKCLVPRSLNLAMSDGLRHLNSDQGGGESFAELHLGDRHNFPQLLKMILGPLRHLSSARAVER